MRLFDDVERTYEGLTDLNESFFSFFNRSALAEPTQARSLCENWFEDYSANARQIELNRYRRFRAQGVPTISLKSRATAYNVLW